MKRNLLKGMAAVLAAAALTAVFAGCGGNKKDNGAAGKTADASSVKIGFITAYTGPGAAYGVAMKEGVDLAVEEINNNPKTKVKIDLKTYDTKLVKAEADYCRCEYLRCCICIRFYRGGRRKSNYGGNGCIRRRTGNCRKRRRCVGNSNFFGRSGTCISGC